MLAEKGQIQFDNTMTNSHRYRIYFNVFTNLSLNKTKRTRELIRVTLENQKILARIQAKQPQYSAKKWVYYYKVIRFQIGIICLLPKVDQSYWIKI